MSRVIIGKEPKWCDERRQFAFREWKNGQSSAQIARQLGGCTRNAVIGVINRAGLSRSDKKISKKNYGSQKTPRRLYSKQRKISKRSPSPPNILDGTPSNKWRTMAQVYAGDVISADLEPHHCQWPMAHENGTQTFCGKDQVSGKSWCSEHHARAVIPSKPPIKYPCNQQSNRLGHWSGDRILMTD